MRKKIKAPPSSLIPGTSKSRPIIVKDQADPIPPKPISEIPRSEILPSYLILQSRPPPKPPDQLPKKAGIR